MESSDSVIIPWAVVAILGVGIGVAIAFIVYRRSILSRTNPPILGVPKNDKVELNIKTYWDEYFKYKTYSRLKNYYAKQFNMKDLPMSEVTTVEIIGNLQQLGLQKYEIPQGRLVLKDMVKKLIRKDSPNQTEGRCISILYDINDSMADIAALEMIKENISDRKRFADYVKKAEIRLLETQNKYSSSSNTSDKI